MTRLYIQKLQTYFQIKGGEKRTAEIMNVFKQKQSKPTCGFTK